MSLLYTLDSETDPFLKGRTPLPFAWNFYNGTDHKWTWGDNCTDAIMTYLYEQPPGIVFLHNGGKFDVFYLLKYIDVEKPMLIIKDRIVQCYIKCRNGYHRLRDSLKILPFSLETFNKTKIDYTKFERDVRDAWKDEIVEYLKDDCKFLWDLVKGYVDQFGLSVSIGGTAMKELQNFHNIGDQFTRDIDEDFRSKWFFGARVERYKTGVFDGEWKVYDVNSMYPYVMSHFRHPIGLPSCRSDGEITDDTFFLIVEGYSHGAFPVRTKTGVEFPHMRGVFNITIHEWKAALELELFDVERIIETRNFAQSATFDNYVNHYYGLRKQARLDGDKMRELFFKFLLNNSYGRFAINPDNFKEYRLTPDTYDMRWHGFKAEDSILLPEFNLILWSKPSEESKYANIATGASITGAARSCLLRGISSAVGVVYCDTDSIICKELNNADIDAANLGAWKLEKTGNKLAIAGRKMYALFQDEKCLKYACKGVKIEPEQIIKAALGEVVIYHREAPTFRLNGDVDWLTRKVRRT